ncbi:MAG TPA: glutaredoxin domain-containing protein [Saprospiraceae bacterium]|nr:glutaredoxin domain-containing protein [Saprospiraceae bacterium]
MNHKVFMFLLLLLTLEVVGQKQDIEILQEQNENITTLVAQNNSESKKIKVNLFLETQGYKVTPPPPYEVVLEPLSKAEIVKLIVKPNEPQSLSYRISYTTLSGGPITLEANVPAEEVKQKLAESSIIIFTKNTCAKCAFAKKKMTEMGMDYKELPLETAANSDLMWSALFNEGFTDKTIGTPIFAIKGKLAYNIADMEVFINGLK